LVTPFLVKGAMWYGSSGAMCLSRIRSCEPRHPLYVGADVAMETYVEIDLSGQESR